MLDQFEQGRLRTVTLAGVGRDDRDVAGYVERLPHLLGRVEEVAVELVDGDDERHLGRLEVVDRPEAVLEPAGVDQNDGSDGPTRQLVPHESESVLARRPEQVEHELVAETDASEVHRNGRRRLRRGVALVVDVGAHGGQRRLGGQRIDVGDRADEGRLADGEAAGNDDLHRQRHRLGVAARRGCDLRADGDHLGPFPAAPCRLVRSWLSSGRDLPR